MVRFLVLYDMPDDPAAFDKHYNEIHKEYYLVAELDWDSTEAMQAAFASEIGQQTGADVPKFAPGDRSHSLVFEVAEV